MKATRNLGGGPAVIARLMEKNLSVLLTEEQAAELWLECRAWMQNRGFLDSIAEAEGSTDGTLDTWPRNDVMAAMGIVLTGFYWPLNGTPANRQDAFARALADALHSRNYAAA